MEKIIKLNGKEYLLVGGDLERGGAIATREQFENFECSYAHLMESGEIKRFGEVIGHRSDIEVVGDCDDAEPGLVGVIETLIDPLSKGWPL